METKLMDLLQDFAWKLQELSAKPIDEMEIILPYENYRQLEYELYKSGIKDYAPIYGTPEIKYNARTTAGINFNITCKELNDSLTQNKLQECFKILSK